MLAPGDRNLGHAITECLAGRRDLRCCPLSHQPGDSPGAGQQRLVGIAHVRGPAALGQRPASRVCSCPGSGGRCPVLADEASSYLNLNARACHLAGSCDPRRGWPRRDDAARADTGWRKRQWTPTAVARGGRASAVERGLGIWPGAGSGDKPGPAGHALGA